ncbi:MAG TPA: DUF2905 domain-containing protein [Armatimonadota bacterium]|jgi:hypothetical protein|nr:DUF2905 domain-containing protein [Armatimonadota bacterium]HOM83209.1 DUF2905 domain-containing protein [Armatimonadota bacterium]HPO73643.1 DUF2905 domain-containing protein [Armatimonadota bacterium]HPT99341.1 DUF2905 domain-containing protein [Armatimonadota bacterium]
MAGLGTIGKLLVGLGILLVGMGLLLMVMDRLTGGQGWRLPGDILIRRGNTTIYIPIATSILVSLLLTALLYLISWMSRR